ncbi:MAG: RluA family pseudouridine synthase [Nitrosomonas sp.]|uniref:RluA family pseudouridine synthase n=1 Tax=Nitrosomonas sp. TaxID=42353 RepID=UPI0027312E10|nr:RluA family pseudouridine synthase [Nitrosomonas sp.]MDP1549236.1 RluA family pseudouridine synthase [Nitrosomonas sp.]
MKVTHKIKYSNNNTLPLAAVVKECIEEEESDQRVDNFLFKRYRNVPKSHLYQLLRSGQVRVNGKRIIASYRLQLGDIVRIPPIKMTEKNPSRQIAIAPSSFFTFTALYEDDALLVIDKPGGLAVHGGSGISFGVIEQLRAQNPSWKFLELVHRLDRDTSGVLMLAKKRTALVELHRQIREGLMDKHYLVMVGGEWHNAKQHVKLALNKYVTASGERRVAVSTGEHADSKSMLSHTIFKLQKTWKNFSLLDAELKTGRTHQIRVHLAHLGFPIIGDDKYGDFEINRQLAKARGQNKLTRMFLHAHTLQITHPNTGERMQLKSPLSKDLQKFIDGLENQ